jgi:hypothetical protein
VGKIEARTKVRDPEKDALFHLRAGAELPAQVRALPHLLQEPGASRPDPWGHQVELVKHLDKDLD